MLFFLFLVLFDNFFTSPVDNENARLRLIPSGVPITVAYDAIETLRLFRIKQSKIDQNNHKKQYICQVFYS